MGSWGKFLATPNIAKARRNTLTFTASGSLIKPIRYSGHFSYNNTKDLTVNKRLRYAPDLLGTFSFETDSLFVNGWIQGRYVGQRIAMYSWPKDVIMEPFLILSGGINWTPYQAITILFSIENFLNKNYNDSEWLPRTRAKFFTDCSIQTSKLKIEKSIVLKTNEYMTNRKKIMLFHRLVALAWIPNPDNKSLVLHINDDRTNYLVNNLKWGTGKENQAGRIGTRPDTMEQKYQSLVDQGIIKG